MFNNLKVAFKDKSKRDLNRSYFLFLMISKPFISKLITKLLKISIFIKLPISAIIKATVYKHFCGGVNIKGSQETIDKLWDSRIGTILDYSAEGKENEDDYNKAMLEVLSSIHKAKSSENIPFTVFKPTGLTKISLLEKMSSNANLNSEEILEKQNFVKRIEKICKTSSESKVKVFVDAEESWIQNTIDDLALKMMIKYNKNKAYIFNTIQLYRVDRIKYLTDLIEIAKKKDFFIGVKLVRGAYHEKEIQRSISKNIKCPVHTIKDNTDIDYNTALKICIQNIDLISICAGTHNENSSLRLINLLEKHNIDKDDDRVYFSQLLGMSDNISYNAAKSGYNVAKYVPYGPVKDVIPYLIRRAEENTSISGQMGRELQNIIIEKKRREREKPNSYFKY